MRPLQITLFIIGLMFLSAQTFRHIHVKFFAPTVSVLDQYEPQIEKDIKASQSLDELLVLYEKAREKVKQYEANSDNEKIDVRNRYEVEPYKSEYQIRSSIKTWEEHDNAINRLRFYWFCGFLSVLIGLFVYLKIDRWVGMAGLITGFTEMIAWTCPTIFGIFGRNDFERLLSNKLFFSLVSWCLLLVIWLALCKIEGKRR